MKLSSFQKTFLKSGLIGLAALAIAAGLYWHSRQPAPKTNLAANIASTVSQASTELADVPDVSLQDQLADNGEIVPLLWTDDNSNENLIIKTDKRYYDASSQVTVYFSVVNQTTSHQQTDIYFWFDGADKKIASVEKIEDSKSSKFKVQSSNQFQIPNPSADGPNRKDIKGYTNGSKFSDTIAAGQINYYKAIIKYPESSNQQSEFFIEAFGYNNAATSDVPGTSDVKTLVASGYGHLDPYIAGGLVGYWTFNGPDIDNYRNAAYDRSSSYATGTMVNMATSTRAVPGISGQALKFDGVDDYVNVGSDTIGIGNVTVCAWLNPKSYGEGNQGTFISNGQFQAETDGPDSRWLVSSDAVTTYALSGSAPVFNTWQHVCIKRLSNGQATFYINGAVNGTENQNSGTPVSGAYTQIGTMGDGALCYDGSIDEVRVYNRALTQSEITQLYQIGAARLKVNTSDKLAGPQGGLVGNWTFDGPDINNRTNQAYDRSSSYATGTMVNMATSTRAVPGISGQALKFDGVDDRVQTSKTFTIPNAFTVSFWTKNNSPNVDNYFTPFSWGYYTWFVNIGSVLYFTVDGTGLDGAYAPCINDTEWHYIVGVNASNVQTLYCDGVSVATGGATLAANTDVFTIGSQVDTTWPYNGLIDEVRVYNRALTASEVLQLYRAGASRAKITQ